MNITLKQLGMQYLEESSKVAGRIAELRALLPGLSGPEKAEHMSRINSLYQSARIAKLTGNYLINYYSDDRRKACE